jgi:transposase
VNVFGVRTKRCFVFQFSKRKKQRDFVRFLEKLLNRFNRLLLFIDGGPCHKGKLVNAFLKKNRKRFHMIRFPAYTPELNPTEQCWKPARKDLAKRLLKTLPTAKYHLNKTFSNPDNLPKMFTYFGD